MKRISAMFALKCPNCFSGNLFYNRSPFSFKRIADMPDECPSCKQDFVIEPGFWFGAMFVSYFISAMAMFIPMGIGILILGSIGWPFVFSTIAVVLLFYVYIFKVSRSIYIHLVVMAQGVDWN